MLCRRPFLAFRLLSFVADLHAQVDEQRGDYSKSQQRQYALCEEEKLGNRRPGKVFDRDAQVVYLPVRVPDTWF